MKSDFKTRAEIDRIVERIVKDARLRAPIDIEEVLQYLKVNRDYYSLDDPSILQKFAHQVRIGTDRIINVLREQINLSALWLPDRKKILIDDSQPELKQLWASFHDAVHTALPWHKDFFLGDTAQTLDPDFQDILEEEANYGASALMFGGEQFRTHALDTVPSWAAVNELKQLHKKSFTTTFRRYIQFSHDLPLAGIISTPWWLRLPDPSSTRIRYFVRSVRFEREFPNVSALSLHDLIRQSTRPRKFGIVGEFEAALLDSESNSVAFKGEAFYNQHDLLTLFCPLVIAS